MSISVIIAAGGVGSRMNLGGSKQLAELAGRPVLARTVAIFDGHEAVNEIVIAIDPKDVERGREVVKKIGFAKVVSVVPGGETRARSVQNALTAVSPEVDLVAVHDGARPLFPATLLGGGLAEMKDEAIDGVVYGVPATDTVKETDAGRFIIRTPERNRLWTAQTPQVFRRAMLEKAYRMPAEVLDQATDDAMLVEIAGGRVKMVMGSEENIKLTTSIDLLVAEEILSARSVET